MATIHNNSASTNVNAIPVSSSLNGDDVMYAAKQTVTAATAPQTSITMNHALARICITVKNNGYAGAAKLSSIKFSGAETAPEGTLNALDGSVTATKSDVTLDVTGDAQTITTAGTIYECLLVPSKAVDGKQDVNLTLTIDGQEKTATLSGTNGVIIAKGTKSDITISLSNSGISVQTVSVEDWNVVEVGGHKVTIAYGKGENIKRDVLVTAYADENTAKIVAFSQSGKGLICLVTDDATCTSTKTNNIYIFTISEIQSDITATIEHASLPSGALEGVFTVADDGNGHVKKVHFSQGNLYYDGSEFKFESNQYNYHTYDSNSNTWGLFGWSTSSTNYGMSTSENHSDYSGNFIDWGNAFGGSIWRTLTYSEWKYLFDHHVNIWGTCNSVPGRFIAPDNFLGGTTALSAIVKDWKIAQDAGIVFLPAADRRTASVFGNAGTEGYYWTSSAKDSDNTYHVVFDGSSVKYGLVSRIGGRSVRLTTEIK